MNDVVQYAEHVPARFAIANKLLSLRGRMFVKDGEHSVASVWREMMSWRETWHVETSASRIRLRRKLLAWLPVWLVDGDLGAFTVRRRFAMRRHYVVCGGPFDGALLSGNWIDLKLDISFDDSVIARSSGRVLTLRDYHEVELLEQTPQAFALVVTSLVLVLADRSREAAARHED